MRTEVLPGAGELFESGPASRRTEVTETGGADRSPLLPVCLEGRKRPCLRTVSLRAKRDDREHPNWNAPALIAGQILDLDVAINPGGPKQKVARKLQAYFGCDPKLCESGLWKGRVRMSKRGVELARTALFQAATCAMLHDPDMKAVFERKKAEGKFYLICVSHVMRIQLRRLVAVLYDRKPFVRSSLNIVVAV